MASFNKVILAGNLTRDPELRYTPKGMAIAEIGAGHQPQMEKRDRRDEGGSRLLWTWTPSAKPPKPSANT